MRAYLGVDYSDGKRVFEVDCIEKQGIIYSGFGNKEILSVEGGFYIDLSKNDKFGWLYLDNDLNIIEKEMEGHSAVEVFTNKDKCKNYL
jgi:hypothetical protein